MADEQELYDENLEGGEGYEELIPMESAEPNAESAEPSAEVGLRHALNSLGNKSWKLQQGSLPRGLHLSRRGETLQAACMGVHAG